jgi:hypothetical protein
MYYLSGDRIQVAVLDPVADRQRLGSRYCAGGYVHQVTDTRLGPLLAGPQWPAPQPDVFHGQGAPEAFNGFPGAGDVPVGGDVGVIGVGLVRRADPQPFQPRLNRDVSEFSAWQCDAAPSAVTMRTAHRFGSWGYRLSKTVRAEGRTVRSETQLACEGPSPLPVRWFAHPFFLLPGERRLFRADLDFSVPENPGFEKDASGWICRKPGHDWPAGCFVQLAYNRDAAATLELEQAHPLLGSVGLRTDFAPTSFPIWGNDRTFSVEPYWEHTIAAGETATWAIEYTF